MTMSNICPCESKSEWRRRGQRITKWL